MIVKELADALDMRIVHDVGADNEIAGGYTSDLLSDVMANATDGCALITIQAHVNTIAVAALAGISAVIVCNNYPITDDMIEAAKREGVAVLQTGKNQFVTSYNVYSLINGG